jgi:hypothetical protein
MGILILGIHGSCQSLYDLNIRMRQLLGFASNLLRHVVMKAVKLDGVSDSFQQNLGSKRFPDEIGSPCLQPGCFGFHILVSRKENDADIPVSRDGPKPTQQVKPVDIRHVDIQQKKIRHVFRFQTCAEFVPGAKVPPFHTCPVEHPSDRFQTHGIIVNDNDLFFHFRFPDLFPIILFLPNKHGSIPGFFIIPRTAVRCTEFLRDKMKLPE